MGPTLEWLLSYLPCQTKGKWHHRPPKQHTTHPGNRDDGDGRVAVEDDPLQQLRQRVQMLAEKHGL